MSKSSKSSQNSSLSLNNNKTLQSPGSDGKLASPKENSIQKVKSIGKDYIENIDQNEYNKLKQKFQKLPLKVKATLLVMMLTLAGSAGAYYFYPGDPFYQNINYDFLYHCPISYALASQRIQNSPFGSEINDYLKAHQTQLNNSYYVAAKTIFAFKEDQEYDYTRPLKILYCGYARLYNQTCAQADFACSAPGPAFDVEAHKEIRVIWINNYTKPNVNEGSVNNSLELVTSYSVNDCFQKTSKDLGRQLCKKSAKSLSYSRLYLFEPTDKFPDVCPGQNETIKTSRSKNFYRVMSSRQAVPISPHIHGLQVEPQYDGNPLSWWDNQGQIGAGFMKNKNEKISYLENPTLRKILGWMGYSGYYKINIYKNVQQPGTLWYHDHAMGVTSFNVRLGLHSYYIIRNSTIEDALPSGEYQKFIFMYTGIKQPTYVTNCKQKCLIPFSGNCVKCIRGNGIKVNEQKPLKYDTTYRFRILNGDFAQSFEDIRFIYHACNKVSTVCWNTTLPFSVIGTDSALRRNSINNIYNISRLASAQRIDILITIDNQNDTLVNEQHQHELLVVCNSVNIMNSMKANQTLLSNWKITLKQKGKKISLNVTLDVPFVDLSKIPESQIAVKRMRPFTLSKDSMGINGHVRFHQGASENPRIGTIQDWYFMNIMSIGHPIHIHLIQFQVLEIFALKLFITPKRRCTYYYMDFIKGRGLDVINSNKSNQVIDAAYIYTQKFENYTLLCDYISDMTTQIYLKFFEGFKNQVTKDSNNISGLNVLEECPNKNCSGIYGEGEKTDNIYKYINKSVDTRNDLRNYQRGWKEVAFVPAYTYAKFRIRWTRTDFPQEFMKPNDPGNNPEGCKRGYFAIDEEAITKSPGYVYHCHILRHEDNDMMRPIMVQPSGCDKTLLSWRQRYQKQFCNYVPQQVVQQKPWWYDENANKKNQSEIQNLRK